MMRRYGLLVLLLLTCAAYAGLLHAGFAWDDEALIVRNRLTTDLGNLPLFFTSDLWDGALIESGVSGYYRPLVLVSFAVDRALFDLWAPGHHLHSLAWHLLGVALLHRLLLRLVSPGASLAGAALFALHPAQSEAVAWVAARNDLMAAALGLGALLCVLPQDARPRRLVAGGLLAWAALMSKESVVLLPLLLLVLDLVEGHPGGWRRYLPLCIGIATGIVQRLLVGVAGAALPSAAGWSLLRERGVEVIGVYGAGISVAWPLSGVRSLEWLDLEPTWRTIAGLATVLVLLVGPLVVTGRRRRLGLAGLAWLALTVLPTLVPVADKGIIGERYLYLGMVGVALWLAGMVPRLVMPLVGAALVPWLVALHHRLPDWASDSSLWAAALEDTPSPYVESGLAHVYMVNRRQDLALPLFVRSLQAERPSLEGCVAIIRAASDTVGVKEAARLGQWALERGCPRTGEHLGYLAAVQAQSGDWELARQTLDGAPADPTKRADVVLAALELRDGDRAAYEARVREWVGARSLEEQALGLLEASGEPISSPAGGLPSESQPEP